MEETIQFEAVQHAKDYVQTQYSGDFPKVAIILGSGLGGLADSMTDTTIVPYASIPGFTTTHVEGHAGRMLIGKLDGKPLICMQGRVHGYEGHDPQALAFPTRMLWALGVEILIVTNAAGSLDEAAGPGSLMAIRDHINMSGINPLVGQNDERFGPRFPDMTRAWDKNLTDMLVATAAELDIPLHQGTYLMVKGPSFETAAEIRAFRTMGANAVGMSTVPECLAAAHCGIRTVGISSITNLAAGMTGNPLSHGETMEFGAVAAVNLVTLLKAFIAKIS